MKPIRRSDLLRAAAVGLAFAAAWLISGIVASERSRPQFPLFLRGLAATVPLQLGLFWSATARGWQRLWAAPLMVPAR